MASTHELLVIGPGSEARFGLANSEDSYLRTVTFHDSVANANQLWAQGNQTLASYGVSSYGQPPLTNITLTQLPGGGALEVKEKTWRGNWLPRYSWRQKAIPEKWHFETDGTTPTVHQEVRIEIVMIRHIKVTRSNYTTYLAAVGSWDGLENTTNDTAYTVADHTYPANSVLFTDTSGEKHSWGGAFHKVTATINLIHNPKLWRESYINPTTNVAAWKNRYPQSTFPIL